MELNDIASIVQRSPLLSVVSLESLSKFIRLCCIAKPVIQWSQLDIGSPCPKLPLRILTFLANAVTIVPNAKQNLDIIEGLWEAFKNEIWEHPEVVINNEEVNIFHKFGLPLGIGALLRSSIKVHRVLTSSLELPKCCILQPVSAKSLTAQDIVLITISAHFPSQSPTKQRFSHCRRECSQSLQPHTTVTVRFDRLFVTDY